MLLKIIFQWNDAACLGTLTTTSYSFFSIFVDGIVICPSFQTINLGIAWDSPVFYWLLLSVSWILILFLFPIPKTGLSSFIGGPATGPPPVYLPCCCPSALLKLLWDLMVYKPIFLAHLCLFLLNCSLCARLLLLPPFCALLSLAQLDLLSFFILMHPDSFF